MRRRKRRRRRRRRRRMKMKRKRNGRVQGGLGVLLGTGDGVLEGEGC
jgi:hypothetical protein